MIKALTKKVSQNFRTFGGNPDEKSGNPVAAALAEKPVMFALGVPVDEVVRFIIKELGH